MSLVNLREFIRILYREKQILEISVPVDPYLEIAEIHRRVIQNNGPALLFTNVKNSPFPLVTNLFGTPRRVELAFGSRPEQLVKALIHGLESVQSASLKMLFQQRQWIWEFMKIGRKTVSRNKAPILDCYQEDAPLSRLPVLTSWQGDGGAFITLPLVYTEHPHTHKHNLGMYRMQVFDANTTGMHWQIQKGGGFHYFEAERISKNLPVTVFLGGPPALIASAIAPVPENVPELLLASLILGQKLAVVQNPYHHHPLVSEAEFAICGEVAPFERRLEGPFGDHYGYYSLTHEFPVFQVKHLWHRKDAIYPATIVGKPYQEDYYLGEFLQRLLSPAFPIVMPGISDLWTYAETGFHPLAAAVVRESYHREALTTAFRILGEGQLSLTKFLILTDQPISLQNFAELLQIVLARFDPKQDLRVLANTSHDTLDYTGGRLNHGSKAILFGVGSPIRELPANYQGEDIPEIHQIAVFCDGCLVVSGCSYIKDPKLASRILHHAGGLLKEWPLVLLVDDTSIVRHQTSFLWTVFTRFNPADDIYANTSRGTNHISYELPIVVDARMKPGYPDELIPDQQVVSTVNQRWREYFPHEKWVH